MNLNWLRRLLSIPSPSKELLSAWEESEKPKVALERPWIKGKPAKVEVGQHVHARGLGNPRYLPLGQEILKGRVVSIDNEYGIHAASFKLSTGPEVYTFYFLSEDVIEYREAE